MLDALLVQLDDEDALVLVVEQPEARVDVAQVARHVGHVVADGHHSPGARAAGLGDGDRVDVDMAHRGAG
jgi:hypothetical protein